MPVAKLKHECKEHPYQDKTYGKDKRLFNNTKKGGTGSDIIRCTVCGKEQSN